MISFILTTILNFINFLIGLLPSSGGFPDGVTDAIARMGGLLYSFDFVLPIALIYSVASWILAFEIGLLAYRFVMWIIRLIRGN